MKVISCAEMKRWESETIRTGTSVATLMSDAVEGCLRHLLEKFPKPLPVVVLCGKGNNGNDGIALAKRLDEHGWKTEIILSHPVSERVPHPLPYVGEKMVGARVWPDGSLKRDRHSSPRMVVDALLGIGASGVPSGSIQEMIEWAKKEKGNRDVYVSLDIPSGMNGDTGNPSESVFPADLTLVLGAMKDGVLRDSSGGMVGVVRGISIGLNDGIDVPSRGEYLTLADAGRYVRRVDVFSNKHRQGVVGIWAGSVGMSGAAVLAAQAAVRSGAGLVKLFSAPEVAKAIAVSTPEVMPREIEEGVGPSEEFFECDSLVIGPGLGRTETTRWFFERVLKKIRQPVVLDADALFFFSQNPKLVSSLKSPFILTPHTGEMSRLVGKPFDERIQVGREWSEMHGGVLVLKGPNSLVVDEEGFVTWNGSGNPGMATGGMGDVLAGLLGGLLAQGYLARDAARLGAFWHGHAADKAAIVGSEASLIASDVIQALGLAWQNILRGA